MQRDVANVQNSEENFEDDKEMVNVRNVEYFLRKRRVAEYMKTM